MAATKRLPLIATVLVLALLSAPASAHLPALYGSEFLRAGGTAAGSAAECMAAAPEAGDPAPFLERIAALELDQRFGDAQPVDALLDDSARGGHCLGIDLGVLGRGARHALEEDAPPDPAARAHRDQPQAVVDRHVIGHRVEERPRRGAHVDLALGGHVEASGDVAWAPALGWKADIALDAIDPGLLQRRVERPGEVGPVRIDGPRGRLPAPTLPRCRLDDGVTAERDQPDPVAGASARDRVGECLEQARRALESGSASECTEALEKIAEMGKILSEVILYDPGTFSSATKTEVDSGEA